MAATAFTSIFTGTRFKEEGKGSLRGARTAQYAAYGNANVLIDDDDGWHEMGCLMEYDYNGQIENYIAEGSVPGVELGIRKSTHKKAMSLTFSYPEEKIIALAKGLSDPTANYPSSPNASAVVSSTVTSITITASDGANFAVRDLIEIVVGDSTAGTAKVYRRIDAIATDTLSFERPLGELPEVGAAVNEVESIDYIESTDDYGDPIMLRIIENNNAFSECSIEQIFKFQPIYGSITPGQGNDEVTVTVMGHAIGDYDSTNDRYNISKRRTLALNT